MGAALKMDPLKIDIAEFWKVKGCPLAKALRNKFKKSKQFPAKKFKCVYSEELLENKGLDTFHETTEPLAENDWHAAKVHTNGTIAHTTAIFGFMLAGLVIQDIIQKEEQ
jgi:tRNA A37 threonylcarbamoyladenosine dehydratase